MGLRITDIANAMHSGRRAYIDQYGLLVVPLPFSLNPSKHTSRTLDTGRCRKGFVGAYR